MVERSGRAADELIAELPPQGREGNCRENRHQCRHGRVPTSQHAGRPDPPGGHAPSPRDRREAVLCVSGFP